MYRLPSPFNAKASNQAISAAGGGSTSTTCSCCLVTLGIASIGTSRHFARLAQLPPSPGDMAPNLAPVKPHSEFEEPALALDDIESPAHSNENEITAPPPALNVVGYAVIGFFALVIAGLAGSILSAITGAYGVGLLGGIGAWIGLFAWVYTSTNRRTEKGIVAGVVSLLGLAVILAIELFIWFKVVFN